MKRILRLLISQSAMDFRRRYLGTLLGGVWALISPLATIGLIYFVFSFGLKSGNIGQVSFIHWLVPGMLSWFYMSESIASGCFAIVENRHLITKMVFPVETLPVTKIVSGLPVHVLLMIIFLGILLGNSSVTYDAWWQLFYYLFCAFSLCVALSYITSACMVFIQDTSQVVGVFLQIFFWATPIFWNPAILHTSKARILLLSPFNYVIQGYRDALFGGVNFWEKPLETGVFWGITLLLAGSGWLLFRRTRPHFADVL